MKTYADGLREAAEILDEAAAIIAGEIPARLPIIDELRGFAAMMRDGLILARASAASAAEQNAAAQDSTRRENAASDGLLRSPAVAAPASQTPRTDAIDSKARMKHDHSGWDLKWANRRLLEHAKELERELADEKAMRAKNIWYADQAEKEVVRLRADLAARPDYKDRYLRLSKQHARLCDRVYEEDGETLKQDRQAEHSGLGERLRKRGYPEVPGRPHLGRDMQAERIAESDSIIEDAKAMLHKDAKATEFQLPAAVAWCRNEIDMQRADAERLRELLRAAAALMVDPGSHLRDRIQAELARQGEQ